MLPTVCAGAPAVEARQRGRVVSGGGQALHDELRPLQTALGRRCLRLGDGGRFQNRAVRTVVEDGGGDVLGNDASCDQPTEPKHCGALVEALWLPRIAPHGRGPLPGGRWSCRNRASWSTATGGGRSCGGGAWGTELADLPLQLSPRAVACHLGSCGCRKREEDRGNIAIGYQRARDEDGGDVARSPRLHPSRTARRRIHHYSRFQFIRSNHTAWRTTTGRSATKEGRGEKHSDADSGLRSALTDAMLILLGIHAVASIGAKVTQAWRSNNLAAHDGKGQRGGGTRSPPRRHLSRDGAPRPKAPGDLVRRHGAATGGRWAIEARRIAGRRYGGINRRGYSRAVMLTPPWEPWRCEGVAVSGERRWSLRQMTRGIAADVSPERGEHFVYSEGDRAVGTRTAPNIFCNPAGGRPASKPRRGRCGRTTRRRVMPGAHRLATIATIVLVLANCRVGEAANPGPPGGGGTGGTARALTARWVTEEGQAGAAIYPRPNRDGFRDIASPGFEVDGHERADGVAGEEYELVAETANTTGWGPLKRRLQTTCADLLLAQETWVLPSYKKEASDWAARNGWESVWAPAHTGPGGGASGGAAVFARRGLGLRLPTVGSHIIEEARAVAAVVEPPGYRPLLTISVYLIDGKRMQPANRAILSKVGKCAEAQGKGNLTIIGGDFQCQPSDVDGAGFPSMVGGKTVAAPSARGTFRTTRAASTIDFFVMSDELVDIIGDVALVEGSGLKGHTPVQVRFMPRATAQKTLAIRQPPTLPVDSVYGPVPPPQQWGDVQRAAEAALAEARRSDGEGRTQALIDNAYAEWCRAAEQEVADATGTMPAKWGLRGQLPKMKWRSVLPERAPSKGQPLAAIATWLKGVAGELSRISAIADDSIGSALFQDDPAQRSYMPHGTTFAAPVRGGYGFGARAGEQAVRRGGRPRPPTDVANMMRAVAEIRNDLGDDSGRTVDDNRIVDLWGRLVHVATRVKGALRQLDEGGAHDDLTLTMDIAEITDELKRAEKDLESARATADRKGWIDWLEGDWSKGARRAHRATRNSNEWQPTTTVNSRGGVTAAPVALLDAYREKYKNYWEATDTPIQDQMGRGLPGTPTSYPRGVASCKSGFPQNNFKHLRRVARAALRLRLRRRPAGRRHLARGG